MISQAALDELQRQAFRAATVPGGWQQFLQQVAATFAAGSAYLRSSAPHDPGSVWIDTGVDPAAKLAYVDHWGAHDPWARHPRGHQISTAGRCFIGSQIVPGEQLLKTDFHADFGRQMGLTYVMSGLVEDGTAARCPATKLALFREDGCADFTEAELEAFGAIQMAVRCALHSHWLLSGLTASKAGMEATLEALPSPAFVLAVDGHVEFVNGAGRALPATLARVAFGALRSVANIDDAEFSARLRMTQAGVPQSLPFWSAQADRVQSGRVHLNKLDAASFPYRMVWPGGDILAMLELEDRELSRRSRTRGVVARYALTAAEEKVLNGLVRGRTPEEAAAELGISMNTIRTHLRHILQKTGSRRIADLLNLI